MLRESVKVLRHKICRCLMVVLGALAVASPAQAQADLAGMWAPVFRNQDGNGMDGDYAGIPLSSAGRWRAQSFVPDMVDVPEWVCRPHSWHYSMEASAAQLRLSPEVDPNTQKVVGYHGHFSMREQEATVWIDGRPHPPDYALHTWSGFSTGEWDGDALMQTTTHMKETHMRRYNVMRSDQAVARTRWRRLGNYLQATVIIYDPINLEEPYIRSSMLWVADPKLLMPPYPCEEATETVVEPGTVPSALPNQPNPLPGQQPDVTDAFGTPYEPRLGGAETMYPEYIKKMRTMRRPSRVLKVAGEGD